MSTCVNEVKDMAVWLCVWQVQGNRICFYNPSTCEASLSELKSDRIKRFEWLLPNTHTVIVWCQVANRQGDPDIFKVMNIVVCKNILIFYVRSLTDNIGWVLQRKQQVHVYIISAFPIVFLKSVLGGMNLEVHGGIERSTSCLG